MNKYEKVTLQEALDMKIAGECTYCKGICEEYSKSHALSIDINIQYYKKISPIKMYMNIKPNGDRFIHIDDIRARSASNVLDQSVAVPVYIIPCSEYDDEL